MAAAAAAAVALMQHGGGLGESKSPTAITSVKTDLKDQAANVNTKGVQAKKRTCSDQILKAFIKQH